MILLVIHRNTNLLPIYQISSIYSSYEIIHISNVENFSTAVIRLSQILHDAQFSQNFQFLVIVCTQWKLSVLTFTAWRCDHGEGDQTTQNNNEDAQTVDQYGFSRVERYYVVCLKECSFLKKTCGCSGNGEGVYVYS